MSHTILFILILSLLMWTSCTGLAAPATTAPSITVITFNVRYGTADDGPDQWSHRRQLFFKTIKSHDPDLLGTQEVLDFQADELQHQLPDYDFIGVGRDDGKRAGEYAPVMFRSKRFELLDKGYFWLSDQPDKPGSVGWDAALTRMARWVKLRDRADGNRQLLFFNTHWDHMGVKAHLGSARLMRQKMRQLDDEGQIPILMTGDLNSEETSEAFHVLQFEDKRIALLDAYRELNPQRSADEATYHAFKGDPTGSRIDFIFHTASYKPLSAAIDRVNDNGRYPSDHFPVIAVLQRADTR